MKNSHAYFAAAALLCAPALLSAQTTPVADRPSSGTATDAMAAQAQGHDMFCTMGMLPHGMGGGMGMGMMPHGQMQHGQMQHGQMQPAAPGQPPRAEGAMMHPVTPMMLIHHAGDLELTQDQVARVSQLFATSLADCQKHAELAKQAHQAANTSLGGPADRADLAAYEARLRETTTHVLQAHMSVVRAGQEALALLTPAQRSRLGQHAMGGMAGHQH